MKTLEDHLREIVTATEKVLGNGWCSRNPLASAEIIRIANSNFLTASHAQKETRNDRPTR